MDANTVHQIMQNLINILIVVLGWLVKEAVQYLSTLRKTAILDYGAKKYNNIFSIANSIYHIVEEEFKGVKGFSEEKRILFDNLISKRIPGITEDDIEHFRQAVCGEINSAITESDLITPAPEFNPETDEADVVNK